MKEFKNQLDLFYDSEFYGKMNWPNDFDGAHQIGGVGFGTSHPGYGAVPPESPKIYESPDKGKTIYERDFGASTYTRKMIKGAVEQQWNITYKADV